MNLKPNIGKLDRFARLVLAGVLLCLAFSAFRNPLVVLLLILGFGWLMTEAILGVCPTYRSLGIKKPSDHLKDGTLFLVGILGVQLTLAYIWWHAGWEKVTGNFAENLPDTLTFFISKNPHSRYVEFLTNVAIPKVELFAQLVQWGQLAIGLGLFLSVIAILYLDKDWKRRGYGLAVIALLAGAVMNANFWFAAGWTGPGTATSNVAMFWPSLILSYIWLKKLEQ